MSVFVLCQSEPCSDSEDEQPSVSRKVGLSEQPAWKDEDDEEIR